MTRDHTPTLSGIVDMITARIDSLPVRGNEHGSGAELEVLTTAREVIVSYVMLETRLQELIDDIEDTIAQKDSAA